MSREINSSKTQHQNPIKYPKQFLISKERAIQIQNEDKLGSDLIKKYLENEKTSLNSKK